MVYDSFINFHIFRQKNVDKRIFHFSVKFDVDCFFFFLRVWITLRSFAINVWFRVLLLLFIN